VASIVSERLLNLRFSSWSHLIPTKHQRFRSHSSIALPWTTLRMDSNLVWVRSVLWLGWGSTEIAYRDPSSQTRPYFSLNFLVQKLRVSSDPKEAISPTSMGHFWSNAASQVIFGRDICQGQPLVIR
jgi:hypothetical protein